MFDRSIIDGIVMAFEGMAALASIIYWPKYRKTPLRWLPIILVYVFLLELYAIEIYYKYLGYNALFYNVYNISFFLYLYYVFHQYIREPRYRNWIVAGSTIFIAASVLNVFFEDFQTRPQLLAYIVGACLLIFYIILYYIEILSTNKVLNLRQNLLFWISVGLLLFYVGYLPIKLTRTYFSSHDNLFMTLQFVHWLLIIIMNGCFTIGFIWTRKK
ncbi:MAG: hypothetical protein CMC08_07390 [Flavobacteriaceae bacterium]|nr:hypothetical protein [Flavobacteriaceae bacterium]